MCFNSNNIGEKAPQYTEGFLWKIVLKNISYGKSTASNKNQIICFGLFLALS